MQKFVFSLLTTLFISVSIQAQTAQEWMEKLSHTYQNIPTYYIQFDLVETGSSAVHKGEIFAAKERYSLDVMDIKQMYDGKTLYTVSKEDKEVTISTPAADSDDLLTPTKVLKMYKTGFKLELEKTETIKGEKVQFVKLTPTSKSEIKMVQVGIKTKSNSLYTYKETYQNGHTRTLTVKDYLENLIIPRALFKFDQSKYEKDGYVVTSI
ncbi:LolA family protein [Moheibacter lacus]|uniref:Outer membrane lipoprotein carrier protein LolA n=1 Tax=Moheibacter lacus TaxID=2745851 RepID=A0A838ZNE4_9FLAO|nr:outer membrane lipoprotein carrier protein LolA [Moheibacter lacus]MBA5629460.1 outer membrane lipoprotein carrier protein LolA [Moheibacter lacus]